MLTKNLFAQVLVGNQISKIFQEKIVVIGKVQVCIYFLIFNFNFCNYCLLLLRTVTLSGTTPIAAFKAAFSLSAFA